MEITNDMTQEEKVAKGKETLFKAKEIISKLEQGENFNSLVKEFSRDEGTARNNGDLGCFKHKQLPAEFENAVLKLKQGEYNKDPVKTAFGYHIILRG